MAAPNPADWSPQHPLARAVYDAGFVYDASQDITVSRRKPPPWQYDYGFCRLYDETTPVSISAIIDCQPIRFGHGGTEWMIELWKGQYGLGTGAEIGIYSRAQASTAKRVFSTAYELLFPLVAAATGTLEHQIDWYASSKLCLEMSFTLKKNGQPLFVRGPATHWWLTGFRWGEFSEPSDLVAEMEITFPPGDMGKAFSDAMPKYERLKATRDHSVAFRFDRTFAPQPLLRSQMHDKVQHFNSGLVAGYNAARGRCGLKTNDPNLVGEKFDEHQEDVLKGVTDYYLELHTCQQKWDQIWKKEG